MDVNKYGLKRHWQRRRLIGIAGLLTEDLFEWIHYARELRIRAQAGEKDSVLRGTTVALLAASAADPAERFAFVRAVGSMGGQTVFLPGGTAGTLADELLALSKTGADLVAAYGFRDDELRDAARSRALPLLNLRSLSAAPARAASAMLTLWEALGAFSGKKIAFLGADAPAARSALLAAAMSEMNVSLVTGGGEADGELLEHAEQFGEVRQGAAEECLAGADAVFCDRPIAGRAPVRATEELLALAKPDAAFLHPLPVARGVSADATVADGPRSLGAREAENLFYVYQAALRLLLPYEGE